MTHDEAAKLLAGLAEQHDIQAQRLIEFGGYDDAAAVYAANGDALRQGISALKERDLIYAPLSEQDRTLIDHYVRSRVGLIPEAVKRLLDLFDHSLAGLGEIRSQSHWPSACTSSHQEFASYIEHVADCAIDGTAWLETSTMEGRSTVFRENDRG